MDKLYRLADQFESDILKLAKRENRRSIEKKLRNAKQLYDTRRGSLQSKKKVYEELAAAIEKETKDMNEARSYMQKAYEVLKNMDLVDSNEVKFIGDDVGYVKNRRIYRLKIDESGDVELEPFNKKRSEDSEEESEEKESEENESEETESDEDLDVDGMADELLATMVE